MVKTLTTFETDVLIELSCDVLHVRWFKYLVPEYKMAINVLLDSWLIVENDGHILLSKYGDDYLCTGKMPDAVPTVKQEPLELLPNDRQDNEQIISDCSLGESED